MRATYPVYPDVRQAVVENDRPACKLGGYRVLLVPGPLLDRVGAFLRAAEISLDAAADPALKGFCLKTAPAAVLPAEEPPPSGYAAAIGAKGVGLRARDEAGFLSALQTLWQLLEAPGPLAAGTILDRPEVRVRSFQIDLGRQPETLAEAKRIIRRQARLRYNECQLYIENSIRLDVLGAAADPGGLTKNGFADLAAFGRDLGVEVVPSLNLLGHMEKVLRHPDFRHLSETRNDPRHPEQPFIFDVCPELPETRAFIAAIIREVCEISPSPKFMAGLDECWTLGSCPLCRARLDADGGAGAIFGDYIRFLHDEIARHGKTMWMWEDMLFYHTGALERIPRDIGMNIWHYQHIEEYPTYSFQNWRRRDSVAELAGRGHPFMLCCGGEPSHLKSMLRFAEGYDLDGLLVVEWEGSWRVQEQCAPGRAAAAAVLWGGEEEPPARVAAALLPRGDSRADVFGTLLALGAAHPSPGVSAPASAPPRYWSWPGSAAARECGERLLAAYDAAVPLPETFEVQRAFLASGLVSLTADCVREETALVGRRMVQRGRSSSPVLDREIARLRRTVALAESVAECGRQFHDRYAAGTAERPMVAAFAKIADGPRELLARLERFHAAPSAATWPYPAVCLCLDAFVIDPCAHRVRLAVSRDGVSYAEIHNGPIPISFEKFSCRSFALAEVPRFVRLEVGGFAALGFRHVRLETLDGTRLPKAVVETAGAVSHPEHLLEFDVRPAFFNEPDVMKDWRSLAPRPVNAVVLEF